MYSTLSFYQRFTVFLVIRCKILKCGNLNISVKLNLFQIVRIGILLPLPLLLVGGSLDICHQAFHLKFNFGQFNVNGADLLLISHQTRPSPFPKVDLLGVLVVVVVVQTVNAKILARNNLNIEDLK